MSQIRFPFVKGSENSGIMKVHANFLFWKLFFKIEKKKPATDFRFSRGRKTSCPLMHALLHTQEVDLLSVLQEKYNHKPLSFRFIYGHCLFLPGKLNNLNIFADKYSS